MDLPELVRANIRSAIKLKINIFIGFRNFIVFYYINEYFRQFLKLYMMDIPTNDITASLYYEEDLITYIQVPVIFNCIDFVLFLYFCIIFRPRKQFPQFYTNELEQLCFEGRHHSIMMEENTLVQDLYITNRVIEDVSDEED